MYRGILLRRATAKSGTSLVTDRRQVEAKVSVLDCYALNNRLKRTEEPIVLESDSRSEDGHDILSTTQAVRTIGNGHLVMTAWI